MKPIVWPLAMALFFAPTVPAAESPSLPLELRVLSYNIHHGRGTDGVIDLARIANVIRATSPDLVALQEVDNQTVRSGGVDQTSEIARMTGLHAKFARQIDFQGGTYGQALLSRFPLSELEIHWLPGTPQRERRIVATACLELPDTKLWFATTHLHHQNESFRILQTEELNRIFAIKSEPAILAGDLNASPHSQPLQVIRKQWTLTTGESEKATFPAVKPDRQIDFIAVRKTASISILSTKVIDEPIASDHRPLLSVLRLLPNPDNETAKGP